MEIRSDSYREPTVDDIRDGAVFIQFRRCQRTLHPRFTLVRVSGTMSTSPRGDTVIIADVLTGRRRPVLVSTLWSKYRVYEPPTSIMEESVPQPPPQPPNAPAAPEQTAQLTLDDSLDARIERIVTRVVTSIIRSQAGSAL